MLRLPLIPALVAVALALAPAAGASQPGAVDPLIGASFDPALEVTAEDGARHAFRDLLDPAGTLVVLGYHRCENLCGVLQRQLAETLRELPPGGLPAVLFASLDPREGPAEARAMRAELRAAVPGADLSRWRFLTGTPAANAALAGPLGMETFVRPGGEVLVHPAATAVLTPGGALSDVFYGFDFTAAELEAALGLAAQGHVGGLRERIVLLCSGLDEAIGRVARNAWSGVRAAAAVTLVLLAATLVLLWRRERS